MEKKVYQSQLGGQKKKKNMYMEIVLKRYFFHTPYDAPEYPTYLLCNYHVPTTLRKKIDLLLDTLLRRILLHSYYDNNKKNNMY